MPEGQVVALVVHGHVLVGGGSVQVIPGGGKQGEGQAAAVGGRFPACQVGVHTRPAGQQAGNGAAAHMAWEPMACIMWETPLLLLKRLSALARPMWAAAAAAPAPD